MSIYRSFYLFASIGLFGALCASSAEQPLEEEKKYISKLQFERNRQFPREFKALKLKNGLEILIIQDQRAAGIDVLGLGRPEQGERCQQCEEIFFECIHNLVFRSGSP